jgi:hypothetical protein
MTSRMTIFDPLVMNCRHKNDDILIILGRDVIIDGLE